MFVAITQRTICRVCSTNIVSTLSQTGATIKKSAAIYNRFSTNSHQNFAGTRNVLVRLSECYSNVDKRNHKYIGLEN